VIGVLGTPATVRQPYVDDLAATFASDCTVLRHGSAELVALAEAKLAGERIASTEIAAAVAPLAGQGMDMLVLACTHFPLLADELRAALPGVEQVDGAGGIARRIRRLTEGQPWPVQPPPGIAVFTGAGPSAALEKALGSFGLQEIRHV
jgi:glutamate racemase